MRVEITTFTSPNQTMASLTLLSAKPKSLFDRSKLWHKSLQIVFSGIMPSVVPNTNYEIRSKALALKNNLCMWRIFCLTNKQKTLAEPPSLLMNMHFGRVSDHDIKVND